MKKALSNSLWGLLLSTTFFLNPAKLFSQANPGGVTGAVAWYKANAGVTQSGGTVSAWGDNTASANNAVQATAANRPGFVNSSINFNPALSFLSPGTSQFMTTPANTLPGGNASRTVFFVASFNNTSTTDNWIYGYGGPAGGSCRRYNVGKLTALNNTLLVSGNGCLMNPANTFWSLPDTPKLGTIAYNSVTSTGTFFDAGVNIGSNTVVGGFNTQTNSGVIGAAAENTAAYWRGTIAEIILFPSNVTGFNASKVESYLALKYGIHKASSYISSGGVSIWDAGINSGFHNDVFGIIRDDGSGLTQLQSNSRNTGSGDGTGQSGKANVVLSASALSNNEYMLIGHDLGSLVFDNTNMPASITGTHNRINRVWLVNRSGTIQPGTVTGEFSYDGLGILNPTATDAFKLLVDTDGDGDFSNAAIISSTSVNTVNSTVSFDVPITTALNASQISLAASFDALPVKLKSFGYSARGCNATLKWTSLVEDNLKSYQVEVNISGTGWTMLREIPAAANNLNVEKNYTTEVSLQSGKDNFFRLKMLDLDGKFAYSPIMRVRCEGAKPIITLLPNPVKNRLTVGGIEPGDQIKIYSIKGAFMKRVVTAGNVEEIDISALASGSYTAEIIRKDRRVHSQVFIKIQ